MKNYTMKLSQKNKLISKIDKKIEKKLCDLSLFPETSPSLFIKKKGFKKHRYFSLCKDNKGNQTFFYARIHCNQNAKKKFITEISFLEKIKKSNSKIKKLVPEINDYGIENSFEWLHREEIKPPPLINYSKKDKSLIFKNLSKKISSSVFEISKLKFKNNNFEKFNWGKYLKSSAPEKIYQKKIITKKECNEIKNIIRSNFSFLIKENKYLSHGDLTLENILSDKKTIWIIDWERTSFNNFAYDIGFLWSHLWHNRNIRILLIENYLKKLDLKSKEKFKILFPIVSSYLALGGAVLDIKGENKNDREKRKYFSKKILKNSIKNFETLIKT